MKISPQERSAWFRESFNKDYRTIYAQRDAVQAAAEVACIARELDVQANDRILDLCCGFGRHLEAFAGRGMAAFGVDLSAELLQEAPRSIRDRVVCADMRRLPFADGSATATGPSAGFSVVVNLFTSFGYFAREEDNLLAAREMARVLAPRGRLCMDLMNAGPTVRDLQPLSERSLKEFHVVEKRRYDAETRRVEKRTTLVGGTPSTTKEYFESVRLFTAKEIVSVLADAGLFVERMLGDFDGRVYDEDAPRMIVLGTKR